MKKIIINIVVVIFIWFAAFTLVQSLKYGAMNANFVACPVQSETGSFYQAGNVFGQSVIFKANSSGRVVGAYEEKLTGMGEKLHGGEIVDACYTDDVYYLVRGRNKSGELYYKLGQLNESLDKVQSVVSSGFDNTMTASKLNVVGNMAYLTMITANHKEAYVYAVELGQEGKTWYLLSRQSVSDGRYFIEALYTGTVLQAGLDNGSYVYYEANAEYNLEADKNQLKLRKDNLESHKINISSFQIVLKLVDHIVWQNLVLAILLAVVVILLYLMLTSRYYALKQYAVIGSALFVLIGGSILFCMRLNDQSIQNSYMNNVKICFDFLDRQYSSNNAYFLSAMDYYNSADYAEAYDELAEFATKTGFVKELVLVHVDEKNERVMVSLNSYNAAAERKVLTASVKKMIRQARDSASIVYGVENILGDKNGVYVVPLQDTVMVKKYIVSVVSMDTAKQQSNYGEAFLLLIGLAMLVCAGAAAGVVVRTMTKDIRELSKAMLENTEEAITTRKPSVNNNEVEFMWNALAEATKRYEKVNYAKYLVLQAYYRFAPRKIETILGKESIIDVNIGDMVHIQGTLAMLSLRDKRDFSDQNYMGSVYHDFEVIGKHQVEEGGVIISMDSSITSLEMMFPDGEGNALKFGINTIHAFSQEADGQKENAFILLHSAQFLYGVSGNSEQTFSFTVSAETEELEPYVNRFRKIGAGLVVTETVKSNSELQHGYRYIGYVLLRGLHKTMKLYQVLDAYPVSKRNRYLASDGLFQDALQSFYNKDFYLARNAFTDVIKSIPEDEIARWYLFTCEKFLNSTGGGEYEYALFAE